MAENNELLRQKDLVSKVGVPKTTLSDWITEFSPFVPIVKQGRTRYYKGESVDVLMRVRELRSGGYDKSQISEKLAHEFPIDVDEVERRAEMYRDPDDGRDAVYLAMQAVGEMANKMEKVVQDNENMRKELEDKIEKQNKKIEQQDEYINTTLNERDRKLNERDKKLNETMTNFIEQNKKKSIIDRIFKR